MFYKNERGRFQRVKEYPIIPLNRAGNFNELNNDLYRMQLADGDVASRTAFNWLLMDAWKLDANKVNERVISGRGAR